MQHQVLTPTPEALADLVTRCSQINRFATEMTAAEELRIAALASAVLIMRQVLTLVPVASDTLPLRQGRIAHWALTGRHLAEAETPRIRSLGGALVLDEHEQVKVLSRRTWRGRWRVVTLWRDGIHGLSASELMEYLSALTKLAQERAPDAARSLLERSHAIESAQLLLAARATR
jgi:hypothetical protein